MKIFNSLHQLWSYCTYCPICKDCCRTVDISIGPDPYLNLISFKKENDLLSIRANAVDIRPKFYYDLVIDLKNNSYSSNIKPSLHLQNIYMSLFANCLKCSRSLLNSDEIIFDLNSQNITNFSLSDETIFLTNYYLSIRHNEDKMLVSKSGIDFISTVVTAPIIPIDFSNLDKLTDKIKTILLFS